MFELMNELARRMETDLPVYPALNLWEDADRFVVEAELPGVKPEAVDIQVVDGVLTLKASRETPDAAYLRRERMSGAFVRSIELPAGVDADRVEAALRDGILTITLPKAEAAKPRRIPVKLS